MKNLLTYLYLMQYSVYFSFSIQDIKARQNKMGKHIKTQDNKSTTKRAVFLWFLYIIIIFE